MQRVREDDRDVPQLTVSHHRSARWSSPVQRSIGRKTKSETGRGFLASQIRRLESGTTQDATTHVTPKNDKPLRSVFLDASSCDESSWPLDGLILNAPCAFADSLCNESAELYVETCGGDAANLAELRKFRGKDFWTELANDFNRAAEKTGRLAKSDKNDEYDGKPKASKDEETVQA